MATTNESILPSEGLPRNEVDPNEVGAVLDGGDPPDPPPLHLIPDPHHPEKTVEWHNPWKSEELHGRDPNHVVAYFRNVGPSFLNPWELLNLLFGNDVIRSDTVILERLKHTIKKIRGMELFLKWKKQKGGHDAFKNGGNVATTVLPNDHSRVVLSALGWTSENLPPCEIDMRSEMMAYPHDRDHHDVVEMGGRESGGSSHSHSPSTKRGSDEEKLRRSAELRNSLGLHDRMSDEELGELWQLLKQDHLHQAIPKTDEEKQIMEEIHSLIPDAEIDLLFEKLLEEDTKWRNRVRDSIQKGDPIFHTHPALITPAPYPPRDEAKARNVERKMERRAKAGERDGTTEDPHGHARGCTDNDTDGRIGTRIGATAHEKTAQKVDSHSATINSTPKCLQGESSDSDPDHEISLEYVENLLRGPWIVEGDPSLPMYSLQEKSSENGKRSGDNAVRVPRPNWIPFHAIGRNHVPLKSSLARAAYWKFIKDYKPTGALLTETEYNNCNTNSNNKPSDAELNQLLKKFAKPRSKPCAPLPAFRIESPTQYDICPLAKFMIATFTVIKNVRGITNIGYCFGCFRDRKMFDRYRLLMMHKKLVTDSHLPLIVSFATQSTLQILQTKYEYEKWKSKIKYQIGMDQRGIMYGDPTIDALPSGEEISFLIQREENLIKEKGAQVAAAPSAKGGDGRVAGPHGGSTTDDSNAAVSFLRKKLEASLPSSEVRYDRPYLKAFGTMEHTFWFDDFLFDRVYFERFLRHLSIIWSVQGQEMLDELKKMNNRLSRDQYVYRHDPGHVPERDVGGRFSVHRRGEGNNYSFRVGHNNYDNHRRGYDGHDDRRGYDPSLYSRGNGSRNYERNPGVDGFRDNHGRYDDRWCRDDYRSREDYPSGHRDDRYTHRDGPTGRPYGDRRDEFGGLPVNHGRYDDEHRRYGPSDDRRRYDPADDRRRYRGPPDDHRDYHINHVSPHDDRRYAPPDNYRGHHGPPADYRDRHGPRADYRSYHDPSDDQRRYHGQPDDHRRYVPPDDHRRYGPPDDDRRYGPPDEQSRYGPPDDHHRYGPPDDHRRYGPPDDRRRYGPPDDQCRFSPPDDHHRYGPPDDRRRYGPPDDQCRFGPPDDHRRYGPSHRDGKDISGGKPRVVPSFLQEGPERYREQDRDRGQEHNSRRHGYDNHYDRGRHPRDYDSRRYQDETDSYRGSDGYSRRDGYNSSVRDSYSSTPQRHPQQHPHGSPTQHLHGSSSSMGRDIEPRQQRFGSQTGRTDFSPTVSGKQGDQINRLSPTGSGKQRLQSEKQISEKFSPQNTSEPGKVGRKDSEDRAAIHGKSESEFKGLVRMDPCAENQYQSHQMK